MRHRFTKLGALTIVVALVGLCVAGCGGGGGTPSAGPGGSPKVPPSPPSGSAVRVVTDNVTESVTDADIEELARGSRIFVRLNRQDHEVVEVPGRFLDRTRIEGFYLCELGTPEFSVGFGDSGAPVLIESGETKKILGGVVGSIIGERRKFFVRPIGQMLPLLGRGTQGVREFPPHRILWGVTDRAAQVAEKAGLGPNLAKFHRRTERIAGPAIFEDPEEGAFFQFFGLRGQRSGSSERRRSAVRVIGGQSIAIESAIGDILDVLSVGAITRATSQDILALAHPLDRRGRRSLPVSLARVHAMFDGPFNLVFKLAAPTEQDLGALTNDRGAGVAITPGEEGDTFSVRSDVQVGEAKRRFRHKVASDEVIAEFLVRIILIASLEEGRDRLGPGNGTFTLQVIRGTTPFVREGAVAATGGADLIFELTLALFDVLDEIESQLPGEPYLFVWLTAQLEP